MKVGRKKNWVSQVAISCDKTTQNRSESIETVPQFNDNLMTQYNEGKGYKVYRTIKIFEFENTTSSDENRRQSVAITEEKGNQRVKQIIFTNQGNLPTKVNPFS